MSVMKLEETMSKPIFSLTDAASAAGMSMPTLFRRIHDGKGPERIRIGRGYAVTADALRNWLATLS